MLNIAVAAWCFAWALHYFLDDEPGWGTVQLSLGILNLAIAFL